MNLGDKTRHDTTPKAIRRAHIRHLQKMLSVCERQARKRLRDHMEITRSQTMKACPPPPKSNKNITKDPNKEKVTELDARTAGTTQDSERKYGPKLQGNKIVDLSNRGTETNHERNRKFRPHSSHTKEVIIIKKRPNKMTPKPITLQQYGQR